MAAPTTAAQALKRDIRLMRRLQPLVTAQFERELARIRRNPGEWRKAIRLSEWEDVLSDIWIPAGETVFAPAFAQYTKEPVRSEVRQKGELVAIVEAIIGDASSAEAINGYVSDAAAGIVKTTNRRIDQALRGLDAAELKRVSRAIRRLYKTKFITGRKKTKGHIRGGSQRDARIAIDQTLKATAEYEHEAALAAQRKTGKEYVQVWRNQGDDRVRPSHSGVAPVPLGEKFELSSGAILRYPRDPAGPSHETYGCRCWTERTQSAAVKAPLKAKQAADAAQNLIDAAEKADPRITSIMDRIRGNLPGLRPNVPAGMKNGTFGRAFRIKAHKSLTNKINLNAKDINASVIDAADDIKDALRYTHVHGVDDWASSVRTTFDSLKDEGMELVRTRNNWAQGTNYRGLNTVWHDARTGQTFELQFHTPDSLLIKEGKEFFPSYNGPALHPLYKEWQFLDPKTPRAIALNDEMIGIADRYIPTPTGWEEFGLRAASLSEWFDH